MSLKLSPDLSTPLPSRQTAVDGPTSTFSTTSFPFWYARAQPTGAAGAGPSPPASPSLSLTTPASSGDGSGQSPVSEPEPEIPSFRRSSSANSGSGRGWATTAAAGELPSGDGGGNWSAPSISWSLRYRRFIWRVSLRPKGTAPRRPFLVGDGEADPGDGCLATELDNEMFWSQRITSRSLLEKATAGGG